MNLKQKINALPNVKRVPRRWRFMQAAKESRHKEPAWKRNPLKQVRTPVAVKVFKQLHDKLRHRMFSKLAVPMEFNPKKLVTYQPVISAAAVLCFGKDEELANRKKAYVLGTEEGPCIWNGNHRAVAALLTKRTFHAMYLDLTGDSKKSRRSKS